MMNITNKMSLCGKEAILRYLNSLHQLLPIANLNIYIYIIYISLSNQGAIRIKCKKNGKIISNILFCLLWEGAGQKEGSEGKGTCHQT